MAVKYIRKNEVSPKVWYKYKTKNWHYADLGTVLKARYKGHTIYKASGSNRFYYYTPTGKHFIALRKLIKRR